MHDTARDEAKARQGVIETAQAMAHAGLSPGTSGNVSCRWGDGILITPTGLPYDALRVEDVAYVGPDGAYDAAGRKPSSEWRFHLAAYRAREDAVAAVHCHSLNATALACAHKPIPAFHYMVAVAGGSDIPLAPYATFGTGELAAHVETTLRIRKACLMANHGQIATGETLPAALDLALEVETLAAQYIKVLEIGEPRLLSAAEMSRVLARFAGYGQQPEE